MTGLTDGNDSLAFDEETFRRLSIFSAAELEFVRQVRRSLRVVDPEELSDTERHTLHIAEKIEETTENWFLTDGLLGHPPDTCTPKEWEAALLLVIHQLRLEDQGVPIPDAERRITRILLSPAFPERIVDAIDPFGFLVGDLGDEARDDRPDEADAASQ